MTKNHTLTILDKCSLCGHHYDGYAFKGGYICEACLDYIKDDEKSV